MAKTAIILDPPGPRVRDKYNPASITQSWMGAMIWVEAKTVHEYCREKNERFVNTRMFKHGFGNVAELACARF
jgi:hypothetical protein